MGPPLCGAVVRSHNSVVRWCGCRWLRRVCIARNPVRVYRKCSSAPPATSKSSIPLGPAAQHDFFHPPPLVLRLSSTSERSLGCVPVVVVPREPRLAVRETGRSNAVARVPSRSIIAAILVGEWRGTSRNVATRGALCVASVPRSPSPRTVLLHGRERGFKLRPARYRRLY